MQETKNSIIESIKLYKENNTEVPAELQGDVEITWTYDTASFMEYFSNIFSKAGLERITGINQKQLGHYASGLKKPRKNQIEKIDKAIKRLAEDLNQVHLV